MGAGWQWLSPGTVTHMLLTAILVKKECMLAEKQGVCLLLQRNSSKEDSIRDVQAAPAGS